MENYLVARYLKLFEALTMEVKLELLTKLTENVKRSFNEPKPDKNALLEQLYGAWSEIDDEKMIKSIYNSRTISDKGINFD
ncbi:MAG: hypothetical protein AAF960_08085 [Bacteroidota bacterium]